MYSCQAFDKFRVQIFVKNRATNGRRPYCRASILKTVSRIGDSNVLKLGEFVHYKTKPCLTFSNKHQMLRGGFDDNFSVHVYPLKTHSQCHANKVLKTLDISLYAQGRQLSLLHDQTQGNV